MLGLFISLALLGLAAIDPIGIAAMLLLLVQENPFRRSFIFLSGSLVSLIILGFVFALGFGETVLHFENSHAWFVPSAEVIAGLLLICIAVVLFWRSRAGKLSVEPSAGMVKWLRLGSWHLFVVGGLLVAIQSLIDVVFLVAMVRVGQLDLPAITLLAAVSTYAIASLGLQLAVVVAYRLTPQKHKAKTLERVHGLLVRYADKVLVGVSLVLGCVLLLLAAYR